MPVHVEHRSRVAVVRFDDPPLNVLRQGVRQELLNALTALLADPAVSAVVVTGQGRAFSAGFDINEFRTGFVGPDMDELTSLVEDAPKPVVAALNGMTFGGGLELALACAGRVAARDATLALPEIQLGLLPGGGGTQRLPRVAGADAALDLVVSGRTITADEAFALGIVDAISTTDLIAEACTMAETLASAGFTATKDRAGKLPSREDGAAAAARARANFAKRPDKEAVEWAIRAVEGAWTLPFREGLKRERALFMDRVAADDAQSLVYAFFAERSVGRMNERAEPRSIATVGVLGAGTMGSGIAAAALAAGYRVTLVDAQAGALARGEATIRDIVEGAVRKGRLSSDRAAERLSRLSAATDIAAFAELDLVVEAVFEDMTVKSSVFEALDATCRPGAVIASNTSSLDLDRLAALTSRPGDVVGLHFFSPAHVMRLLEVVRGRDTSGETLATSLAFAKRLGKLPVIVGVCDGFVANRMIFAGLRQVLSLAAHGIPPEQIDQAITGFGFPMGPFAMMDLAGTDIPAGIIARQDRESGRPTIAGDVLTALVAAGRTGQKSGRGWFDYGEGDRSRSPSRDVEALLASRRDALGLTPIGALTAQDITDRYLLALINEGARILEEGVAGSAEDIDVIYLNGFGFPRRKGGPMFEADRRGLPAVVAQLETLSAFDPSYRPAPLLVDRAKAGQRLTPRALA